MDRKTVAIVSLVVLVTLAGCTAFPQQETEKDRPDTVQLEGPTCQVSGQPCSSGAVTKYASTGAVRLTVSNNGDSNMTVFLGDVGRKVMTSKCNSELVNITGYTVKNGSSGVFTERTRYGPGERPWNKVELGKEERVVLEWELDVVPGNGYISRLGQKCHMGFELGFNQTVETRKQIQLRRSEEVPKAGKLSSSTTSKRPVRLVVESPATFLASPGQDRTLVTKAYLRNVGTGEVRDIFYIKPAEDTPLLKAENCEPENRNLIMYGRGDRAGESYRRVCTNSSISLDKT
ncbi:MAG: hypothetical protein ABEI07_01535, partial [Candidatus Nanohaloarchaea archaeon]